MRLFVPFVVLFTSLACAEIQPRSDREDPFASTGDRTFDDPSTDADPGDDDDADREWLETDGPGSEEDLCRTRGFWSNHAHLWPTASLELGARTYSADAMLDLLRSPSVGDASRVLAAQLIPAELNVAIGAPADAAVFDALDAAHAWLAAHDASGLPFGVATSTPAGSEAVAIASALDAFNNQDCPQ